MHPHLRGNARLSVVTLIGLAIAAIMPANQAAAQPASRPADASGQLILTQYGNWRAWYVWKTPLVRVGEQLKETGAINFICKSPAVPADWAQPEFDDSSWSRWRLTGDIYGFEEHGGGDPSMAAVYLRGKFRVDDPAAVKGLTLSLTFRGGAAVHVNGREIARANLPRDAKIDSDTLADDYPAEAFLTADGKCVMASSVHGTGIVQANAENLAKRLRTIGPLAIDGKLLRKGVNVISVEMHRTAYQGPGMDKEGLNHRSVWSTCGLSSLQLAAESGVAPNTARPAGVQVWVQSPMVRTSPGQYADPSEPPGEIRIVAARNGVFDGKAVVSSPGGLKGVSASIGDLTGKGRKIAASSIKLLYSVRDDRNALRYQIPTGFWDTLLDSPPAEVPPAKTERGQVIGAVQPIVVRVPVPADAAPGDYEGKLTVNPGEGSPVDVAVRLRVSEFKLPDPRDFTVRMDIIESPESVALQYKLPLWSEEHWKHVERSFALMGEVGAKTVCIPLLCRTNFGNAQSMVRWVKDGDKYTHDFSVFDRYLDIAQKHLKPDVIFLYIWDKYTGVNSWGRPGERGSQPTAPVAVTLLTDPKTGAVEELLGPKAGDADVKTFWAPVFKEILAKLEKRGLLAGMMLGPNGDAWIPGKEYVEPFKALAPNAKWACFSHADQRGGAINGIPVGFNTSVYINLFPPPGTAVRGKARFYGWQSTTDIFPRSHGPALDQPLYHSSTLAQHRGELEGALLANCAGVGRIGADFWPVMAPPKTGTRTTSKRSETINGRFIESDWNQLNMNTSTEALFAPGPDGAVTTERFENLREGAQLCEARILIEKAILSGKLDADFARKCQDVLDERAWVLRSACLGRSEPSWHWYAAANQGGLDERLFNTAAEVTAKTRQASP